MSREDHVECILSHHDVFHADEAVRSLLKEQRTMKVRVLQQDQGHSRQGSTRPR